MQVVSFGKYKGWKYADLCQRKPNYVTWMASRSTSMSEGFNEFRSYCTGITSRRLLYILPLTDSKYYVGITSFPVYRLWQHRNGKGSRWSRLYRPVGGFLKLQAIPSDVTPGIFEDMWVKQLMLRYGLDAVRGGSYSNIHLDNAQAKCIREEITHALRQSTVRQSTICTDVAITPPPKSRRKPVDVSS